MLQYNKSFCLYNEKDDTTLYFVVYVCISVCKVTYFFDYIFKKLSKYDIILCRSFQFPKLLLRIGFGFFFDLLFLLTKSGQSEFDYPLSIRFESTNENTRLNKFYNFIYCFSVFLFFDALV